MTRALLVIRELFLSRGAYARQYFTRVQPSEQKNRRWSEFRGLINLRYTRYTRAGGEVTLPQEAALTPIHFSAESLASAPNLRLRIVRLAIFRATNLALKSVGAST